MGLSPSKRVEKTLRSSPELDAACGSVYDYCMDQAQYAFPGIRPYQLLHASTRLHAELSDSLPLVKRWVPSPPDQSQVNSALRRVDPRAEALDRTVFKVFSVELFRDAIVSGAGQMVFRHVPVGIAGIAGIAGIGLATRSGKEVVGRAMGVYALGLAVAVYFSLS